MFRLTRIFPFECLSACPPPPSVTRHMHGHIFVCLQLIIRGRQLLGSLHPSFLAPRRRGASSQTRPNLGGVKDLSVSRSEVITVVPVIPLLLAIFPVLARIKAAESGASLGRLIRPRGSPRGGHCWPRKLAALALKRTGRKTQPAANKLLTVVRSFALVGAWDCSLRSDVKL